MGCKHALYADSIPWCNLLTTKAPSWPSRFLFFPCLPLTSHHTFGARSVSRAAVELLCSPEPVSMHTSDVSTIIILGPGSFPKAWSPDGETLAV